MTNLQTYFHWDFSSPIILAGPDIISSPFVDYTVFNIDTSKIELVDVRGRTVSALVLRANGASFVGFESCLDPTFFLLIFFFFYGYHFNILLISSTCQRAEHMR